MQSCLGACLTTSSNATPDPDANDVPDEGNGVKNALVSSNEQISADILAILAHTTRSSANSYIEFTNKIIQGPKGTENGIALFEFSFFTPISVMNVFC